MKRQRGMANGWILLGLVIGIIVALTFLVHAVTSYVDDVDAKAYQRGVEQQKAADAKAVNDKLQKALARVAELEAEKAKREAEHAAVIAEIDAKGQKEVANAKARSDRFIDDVHAGRIRLFDPRRSGESCAGGSDRGTGAAQPGAGLGDGAPASELPRAYVERVERTLKLGAEADEVVAQLTACQGIVGADRKATSSP